MFYELLIVCTKNFKKNYEINMILKKNSNKKKLKKFRSNVFYPIKVISLKSWELYQYLWSHNLSE